jgi:hypothetical protein
MGVTGSFKSVRGAGNLQKMATATKSGHIKVGVLSTAKQEIINRAWWNEFGTANAPARPFLRPTMAENRKDYFRMQAKLLDLIMVGKMSVSRALAVLGTTVQADIRNKIISVKTPPDKAETVEEKNSTNPLVATGALKKSIDWTEV